MCNKLFEDIISENTNIEYFRLYNDLTTQIGILYDKIIGFKSILRISEATDESPQILDEIYIEIDESINEIKRISSEIRSYENSLIFTADHVSVNKNLLNYEEQLNNFYIPRRTEAFRLLVNSDNELMQIKTDVIDQIKRIGKRTIITGKWNTYKIYINEINAELNHIDDIIIKGMKSHE